MREGRGSTREGKGRGLPVLLTISWMDMVALLVVQSLKNEMDLKLTIV